MAMVRRAGAALWFPRQDGITPGEEHEPPNRRGDAWLGTNRMNDSGRESGIHRQQQHGIHGRAHDQAGIFIRTALVGRPMGGLGRLFVRGPRRLGELGARGHKNNLGHGQTSTRQTMFGKPNSHATCATLP